MNIALIGAGGHAKAVADLVRARGLQLACYVSPEAAAWLSVPHLADEAQLDLRQIAIALGLGGVEPAALQRRLALLDRLLDRGAMAPVLVHPSATVSDSARLEAGVIVMPGAVINAFARLERGVIVNSRAIVEHEAEIGGGAHIAPGSVVLGAARVGRACMIGAGSVILQGASVPEGQLVRALSLFGTRA